MSWNLDPTTPSTAPRTVLIHEFVTGGGMAGVTLPESWAREGAAMRRALAAEFARAAAPTRVVVTIDPRLPRDDGPWESVAADSLGRLEALAASADYTLLIAPETDGVLESLTRRLGGLGCRLLGSDADAVALTADKAALAERLDRRGIPTPRTRILDAGQGAPRDWSYPAVVKPVDGAGSVDTFLVEADADPAPGRRRLLQEFIPGDAMSATFLAREGRSRLIAFGRQRMRLRAGRFAYEGGVLPCGCQEALEATSAAVASVEGLNGLVGVDFIYSSGLGRVTVLEINPRPTTSCVGLTCVLPPGLLADAWLARDTGEWSERMDRIASAIATASPIRFDAAGESSPLGSFVEARP